MIFDEYERLNPFVYHIPYNICVRVVSDIQPIALGWSLYIRYNTTAHIVNITCIYCNVVGSLVGVWQGNLCCFAKFLPNYWVLLRSTIIQTEYALDRLEFGRTNSLFSQPIVFYITYARSLIFLKYINNINNLSFLFSYTFFELIFCKY